MVDVFVVLQLQSHESDAYVIEEFSATSAVDDVAERGRNIKTMIIFAISQSSQPSQG
jgi:hypothetical protein